MASKICSLHLKQADLSKDDLIGGRLSVKTDALPSNISWKKCLLETVLPLPKCHVSKNVGIEVLTVSVLGARNTSKQNT